MPETDLSDSAYRTLAQFRLVLRSFLAFSERAAHQLNVDPQQHQLLLAIRGLSPDQRASVGQIAGWLAIQHHSAVELVDRAEEHGWVTRARDSLDRRKVLVSLTPAGEQVLSTLSCQHWDALRAAAPSLEQALSVVTRYGGAPACDTHHRI